MCFSPLLPANDIYWIEHMAVSPCIIPHSTCSTACAIATANGIAVKNASDDEYQVCIVSFANLWWFSRTQLGSLSRVNATRPAHATIATSDWNNATHKLRSCSHDAVSLPNVKCGAHSYSASSMMALMSGVQKAQRTGIWLNRVIGNPISVTEDYSQDEASIPLVAYDGGCS